MLFISFVFDEALQRLVCRFWHEADFVISTGTAGAAVGGSGHVGTDSDVLAFVVFKEKELESQLAFLDLYAVQMGLRVSAARHFFSVI